MSDANLLSERLQAVLTALERIPSRCVAGYSTIAITEGKRTETE